MIAKSSKLTSSPQDALRTARTVGSAIFIGDCQNLTSALPKNSVDLIVSSPPYNIGKAYDVSSNLADFINLNRRILPDLVRVLKPGGHLCWQVGYHANKGTVFPLDYAVFDTLRGIEGVFLRNRIIWTFGHGVHARNRFSGRHEVCLWFSKGEDYYFDLDSVRVPQKYPGKRYYKGPNKGKLSGNPLGKNPGDVWDIPNVKAKHVEKTSHPCQFPVALAQILVRALCPSKGLVFDPFMGVGSAAVAAVAEGRRFVGAEIVNQYARIANQRVLDLLNGNVKFRPWTQPALTPNVNHAVAQLPNQFFRSRAKRSEVSVVFS